MPVMFTMMNATTNARIKLKNGPATTVAIRLHTFALRKEPGPGSFSCPVSSSFSTSPSSPSNIQAPPIGNSLSEYFVPPFLNEKIFGPMPTANSTTWMPFAFAIRKCPNSWAITTTPKITINQIKVPIYCLILPAIYS